MTKVSYKIVEHDGGWAYKVDTSKNPIAPQPRSNWINDLASVQSA